MEGNDTFPHLLAPGRIGHLSVRNRMVMPPMATNFGTSEGFVTKRLIDYYAARAAGGAGLLMIEITCVDYPRGKAHVHQLGIDDDKFLPGLHDLAAAIKRHGAAAMVQLHHGGRESRSDEPGSQPVAPSAIRSLNPRKSAPRALTVDEIQELVCLFAEGAVRARRAGFDGAEVHAAHSYLLSQFLSPLCNARTDEYGGTIENRARIVVEIVRAIRARLGRDFALCVRLSGDEYAKGGITIEESCKVARMLEDAGADVIHVSAGGHASPKPVTSAPASFPSGFLLPLAAQVKECVCVPVIAVGRLNKPAVAEEALRDGKCDFVALGRTLIADPEFPNKVAAGRTGEIRPCTACMHCANASGLGEPLNCANNPFAGREGELAITPAASSKTVFVIGGGVAGMEAARTAAGRGHAVTLYERDERLGGQLIAAAVPPHKGELNLLRDYYLGQLARSGVEIRLGRAVGADEIAAARPDAVVVATGSRPRLPDIPGIERGPIVFAEDVLLDKAATGRRVVVLGGERIGCETAEYLATQGKEVTITRRGQRLAASLIPMLRRQQLDRLAELSVVALTGVEYVRIEERGVLVKVADGSQRLLEADTVVIAAGSEPAQDLAAALRGSVPEIVLAGDAVAPRRFCEAIREGLAAALGL